MEHESAAVAELKPEFVVQINQQTGRFELKYVTLERIFTEPAIKNLKAAIISIAGPYRKGKSFLLNFFIRYFRLNRIPNWLEQDVEDALQGFHWHHGANLETFGILLWPKPFVIDDVAVFLMDTQGFDGMQSFQNDVIVLAFTLMVSTVTIYNLYSYLQFNYFDHMYFCTEFGRISLEQEDESPFEQLVCLVRDWEHIQTYDYGFNGGQECLASFFGGMNGQNREICESLQSTYNMKCFLMARHSESQQRDFCGKIVDLSPTFGAGLNQLVPQLVSDVLEANPTLKTCCDTLEVFAKYFNRLSQMPPVRNHAELQGLFQH